MKNNCLTNLLWTGGWDSTFRLLYLLLIEKRIVQTYYIIDINRRSTGREIVAMRDIKACLYSEYPGVRELLKPTVYKKMNEIKSNEEITASFNRIRERIRIGTQYDWLARFASEMGIEDLELGIEKDARASYAIKKFIVASNINSVIEPFIVRTNDNFDNFFKIDQKYIGKDEYTLFKYFRFPLIILDKVEMETIAKKKNFYDILKLTWFCFSPNIDGTPCGICSPCICTIKGGLAKRIPFAGRIKYQLRTFSKNFIFQSLRILKTIPAVYSFLKNIKNKIYSNNKLINE